ncbi:hypothetical protein K7432_006245 [Basidiobolus ranarum]|uniref:Transferase n=1 Tax=Basidiobolus ranarum TaxID=34480 RepID=A0ABR2WV72_9FUNG
MSVSIVNQNIIKLENPTLGQHEIVRLTNNDVVMPRCFTRLALFFKNTSDEATFMPMETLKASLVKLLGLYPILTGTLTNLADGNMEIELNNQGVLLVEAKTTRDVSWFLKTDFQNLSDEYFPCGVFLSSKQPYIFASQITRLPCNSVILSAALHHSVGDGNSFFSLLNNWSRLSRGLPCEPISHNRELLKATGEPRQEHPEYRYVEPTPSTPIDSEVEETEPLAPPTLPPMETKVFHIQKEKLLELKQAAQGDVPEILISTNDALIALIWRAVTRARGLSGDVELKCGFACDGRNRLSPPLPSGYFGNVNFYPCSELTANQLISNSLQAVGRNIRENVDKMTSERIQDALNWVNSKPNKSLIQPGFSIFLDKDFAFTSWHKFPVYEVNFGYGTPIRARLPVSKFDGLAISLPRHDGDGLEVYVGLVAENMRAFQMDEELLRYSHKTTQ